jgi:hypothetical protein
MLLWYRYINDFDGASAFCAIQLGYLASVANAFENAALLGIFLKYNLEKIIT